jgi:hypothetical protein
LVCEVGAGVNRGAIGIALGSEDCGFAGQFADSGGGNSLK